MIETIETRRGTWVGWLLTAVVTIALLADAAVNLWAPGLLAADMEQTGFSPSTAHALGVIVLICAALYAYPRTAVLGAILVTGFLGGAICTHFRIGEIGSPPQLICVFLGLMTWGGLYFRDRRLRELLPLVR